jgi:hypothetical protein
MGVQGTLDAGIGDQIAVTHGAIGVALAVLHASIIDALVSRAAVPVLLALRADTVFTLLG